MTETTARPTVLLTVSPLETRTRRGQVQVLLTPPPTLPVVVVHTGPTPTQVGPRPVPVHEVGP